LIVRNSHPRRLAWLTGSLGQPPRPFRPPRAFMARRELQPLIGTDIERFGMLGHDLVGMACFTRRRDDAGIVTAADQEEGHVGIDLVMDLVDGLPGRDVIPD